MKRLILSQESLTYPYGFKVIVEEEVESAEPPIVFLPLMTKPAREVEKGTKYLPEVWKPNG